MATIKSYTDLEQSEKLAKILPLESADMSYTLDFDSVKYEISTTSYKSWVVPKYAESYKGLNQVLPCWSLAALLNFLPSEFTQKGKYSTTTYKIDIRKYKFTDDVDLHQIAYGSIKIDVDGQYSFKDMINTGEKENLIDACVQMIINLKELNLL